VDRNILLAGAFIVLGLTACSITLPDSSYDTGSKMQENNDNINVVTTMLPSLEGIEEATWEKTHLGSGAGLIPGPTDCQYQGYITLDRDVARNYKDSYEWIDSVPEVELETLENRDVKWKYSPEFTKDYVPGYYYGKLWFNPNDNTILFFVRTT